MKKLVKAVLTAFVVIAIAQSCDTEQTNNDENIYEVQADGGDEAPIDPTKVKAPGGGQ